MKATKLREEFYSELVRRLFDAVMEISADGGTVYMHICRFAAALEGKEIPFDELKRRIHKRIVTDAGGLTALTSECLKAQARSGNVKKSYPFSMVTELGVIKRYTLTVLPSGRGSLFAALEENALADETLTLMQNKTAVSIRISDICYVDYENHSVLIHTETEIKRFFSVTFAEVAASLENRGDFLRSYKNCLVNLEKVGRIEDDSFIMKNGDIISIPKRRAREIKGAYAEYVSARQK